MDKDASTYLTMPAEMRTRIPISIWYLMSDGNCEDCGGNVIYYKPAYKDAIKQADLMGVNLVLRCPICAGQANDYKPVIVLHHKDAEAKFDKLTARG